MVDIKSFIERKGMRKADLCRALGMDSTSSLMSSYEKGRSDPSYDKCEKLIRLGITVQELFGEELGNLLLENSLQVKPQSPPPEFLNDPKFQEGVKLLVEETLKAKGYRWYEVVTFQLTFLTWLTYFKENKNERT